MGKLLLFELKKIWKQKKLLWLGSLLLGSMLVSFLYNQSQQESMGKRAAEQLEPMLTEATNRTKALEKEKIEGTLNEGEAEQLTYASELRFAGSAWLEAINQKRWDEIPLLEGKFLDALQQFEEAGGEFSALQGKEREKAIQKNAWMQKNNIPYEEEHYPVSPPLFLMQMSELFVGTVGLFLLLLFFGNTIAQEREQNTWLTLKTQPIKSWRIIVIKYSSLLLTTFLYIGIVLFFSVLIPFINGKEWIMDYPHFIGGEQVEIRSTSIYFLQRCGIFLGAALCMYSLALFFSRGFKTSFQTLLLTSTVLSVGGVITHYNEALLSSPFNPFQLFLFSPAIYTSSTSLSFYLANSLLWSSVLLLFATRLQERENGFLYIRAQQHPFKKGKTRSIQTLFWVVPIFEWRKLVRRGYFSMLLGSLVILIAIDYVATSREAKEKETAYFTSLLSISTGYEENQIPFLESTIKEYKEIVADAEEQQDQEMVLANKDHLTLLEENLKQSKELMKKLKDALAGYQTGNITPLYEYQLFENQLWNGEIGLSANYYLKDSIGQFTLDVSIAEKKWLMEKEIMPIFPGNFYPTIFHGWGNRDEERIKWETDNRKVDDSGMYFIYSLFQKNAPWALVGLLLVIVGGGLASERGKKEPLRLLKTQPLTEIHYFFGKIVYASLLAFVTFVFFTGFALLIGTLFNRIGDWNYPILYYDSHRIAAEAGYSGIVSGYYGFHFIPLGNYLLQQGILFFLILLFCVVLANVLGVFCKNIFSVLVLTGMIIGCGFVLTQQFSAKYIHLSPFIYFNSNPILNGELAIQLKQSGLTVTNGVLVLMISIVIMLGIGSMMLLKRRTGKDLKKEKA